MTNAALAPGFQNIVEDSQSCFTALMRALAQPGLAFSIPPHPAPPAALPEALTAILLTLVDQDTPVWLSARLHSEAAIHRFIAFHCGATITQDPEKAAFAFAEDWASLPPLEAFSQGVPDYPDRSTTLVVATDHPGETCAVRLTGPGIAGHRELHEFAMPAERLSQWQQNHGRFPLGIDLVLTCGTQVIGLPRSTAIEGPF